LRRKGKRKMTSRNLFQSGRTTVKTRFTTLIITVIFFAFTAPAFAADELIVIGHRSPDTDTVTSANLKNIMGIKEAFPAVPGDLNNETKFVLDYFKVPYPEKITDCQHRCKKIILVDHNDMAQAVDNLNMKNVVEVVDLNELTPKRASIYREKFLSRKMQVIPLLEEAFKK